MAITLYGDPVNSRAYRTVWMLQELGLPFENVPVNAHRGETHTPEFLQVNPNGRVPVLDDNGVRVIESMAINLYLARKYPSDLSPRDLQEETQCVQWSFWVSTEIEKPILWAAMNHKLFAPQDRSAEEAAVVMKKLSRPFTVLERHLASGHDYLVGDRFTVADLNVSTVMAMIPVCSLDVSAYPALQRWLDRTLGRPAAAGWKAIGFTVPRPDSLLGMMQVLV